MQWSRYNLMFESKRNKWLLYNFASNSFIQIEDNTAKQIKQIISDSDVDFSDKADLFFKLCLGGFLVEKGKDSDLYRMLKLKRLTSQYDETFLDLTIGLTQECNFACEYCYEPNKIPSQITDETEDEIINFIQKHTSSRMVRVTWYGGEPLLAFERIKSLSRRIKSLGKVYNASIVTNGYNLLKNIISELNDLKITSIQITIDGGKETHDNRRFLIGGGATYERILDNLDSLMRSDWNGLLNIRVNIDKKNKDSFPDVFNYFKSRYPAKFGNSLVVHPGFVTNFDDPTNKLLLNSDEKWRFAVEMKEKYGISVFAALPSEPSIGGCMMTKRYGYLIGPTGDLYKCWNDYGKENETIGNIRDLKKLNTSLLAECMIGGSQLDDIKCTACLYYPICNGGCSKVRQLNRRDNGNRDTCLYYKNYITELLEMHYEQKQEGEKQFSV